MSKLFLQKHLNMMKLKKNDVSRDRDPCYFFFLFSTSVLIFSLPLVYSGCSVVHSFMTVLVLPCRSNHFSSFSPTVRASPPFSFPLHLHRVLLRRRSGSVVRSFWSLLVVSASGTNLSSPKRVDQRSCSYKKRLFVVLLLWSCNLFTYRTRFFIET